MIDTMSAPPFHISLAQWSLHRAYDDGSMEPLDFARTAHERFGIDAVEYVNGFFPNRAADPGFVEELRRRADEHGVRSLLIMVDRAGDLGDPDAAGRRGAVADHRPWIEAAATLGCHAVRVNARSVGPPDVQRELVADGLRALVEIASPMGIDVLVENHGGLSSNGAWLASVMDAVDHPGCGTLPDFGNFLVDPERDVWYDRYLGVRQLMPHAKAVSAKSHDFDDDGNEVNTDFRRMMGIVLEAGYRGFVGIEYEGDGLPEPVGVERTRDLLYRIRRELGDTGD